MHNTFWLIFNKNYIKLQKILKKLAKPCSGTIREKLKKHYIEILTPCTGLMNQKTYIDSEIATKFGEFNIRVYNAPKGNETVVLWKGELSSKHPTLVRIHSECITGDCFGGLNCDCGKQLAKALIQINREGGVFIYLRQEGRGIGLFDKIKSYHLQKKGYDTYEANVLIGHRPDERSYEMAKKVLDDLHIKRIKLLTNNPAKISELARNGIKVECRIPLLTKPNKYNRDYFKAKSQKFSHSFNLKNSEYFYQFHVENAKQVNTIGEFLLNKRNDPFQNICVGITTNNSIITNPTEILRIKRTNESCLFWGFTPVLHYSFKESSDFNQDINKIAKTLPFIHRIQINDVTSLDYDKLKKAFQVIRLDIPFSDENFELVHDAKIRNLIKSKKAYFILDNSKGRGIQEPKELLMKKIESLLSYGITQIGLYGGFGPNSLALFFEMNRYYHLNFSIDAESKLKTGDKIDLEKTKIYLHQLLSFDLTEPNNLSDSEKTLIDNIAENKPARELCQSII